jgi:hypothetical protein
MINRWGNTSFYGFNPSILSMKIPYADATNNLFLKAFETWGWLIIPIGASLFAIQKLRKDPAAQYIFAAFSLCLFAGLPLTGWILGYFLSAWMLERSVWLFPFGISFVFFARSAWNEILNLLNRTRALMVDEKKSKTIIAITRSFFVFLGFGMILLYMQENSLPNAKKFETKIKRYQEFAKVGNFLDNQTAGDSLMVIGSGETNDILLGVSWKARVITFRASDLSNMAYFTSTEAQERISDSKKVFSEQVSPKEKLGILEKYNIDFIVLHINEKEYIEGLTLTYPDLFISTDVGRYTVIKIK